MLDELDSLRWQKIDLRLKNRRNTYAREHPVFIFKGILKSACSVAGVSCDYLYHPKRHRLPTRIRLGEVYELEVVFPTAGCETAERVVEGIRAQLSKEPRNFELISISGPTQRSLEHLRREQAGLSESSSDEICLDFVTPLVFHPLDSRRPWMLDAEAFIRLCAVHVARLYPHLSWPLDVTASGLHLLPYYWDSETILHGSKSQPRKADGSRNKQRIMGFTGPLFIRGGWRDVLPLLQVCSELHTGYGKGDEHGLLAQRIARSLIANPQGCFRLCENRPHFDTRLLDKHLFAQQAKLFSEDSDAAEEIASAVDGGDELIGGLVGDISRRDYRPAPVKLLPIEKKGGGTRSIGLLGGRDLLAQRAVHSIIAPVVDRMLEHSSVGYRKGRSVESAKQMLHEAVREGAAFAVRSDVDSFFDQIDWGLMMESVRRVFPRADENTISFIDACIRCPSADGLRTTGLIQGSPLSPLLANLYLDTFDEQIAAKGHRLIRFGDDFVILARTLDEAERACADANEILKPLGLSLNESKTSIAPINLGFTFLGVEVPSTMLEHSIRAGVLRKPLYITRPYAFTGIEGESVVIRKGRDLLARVPLYRVGEIVFLGDGSVSTRLLQKCSQLRIPVSFCSSFGWYSSTLKPDSKNWFGLTAAHWTRHEQLDGNVRVRIARSIVAAKIRNYAEWFRSSPVQRTRDVGKELRRQVDRLEEAVTIESLRGLEGASAKSVYRELCQMILRPGFESAGRVPRKKPDRLNSLLDTLYSLLFTRINVQTRSAGLNPYLGFLHSHLDNYESLVCDLQEPFRCRVDRLALKLVNREELVAESFELTEGGWRLTRDGVGRAIEAFEREEQVRLAGEGSTFGQLITGQVNAVRDWVVSNSAQPAVFVAEVMRRSR